MTSTTALATRLQRLEDREAIKALIARYGLVMDDRDMQEMPGLFTEDVRILSRDGVMDARGRDAVIELYRGRFAVLGPSLLACLLRRRARGRLSGVFSL